MPHTSAGQKIVLIKYVGSETVAQWLLLLLLLEILRNIFPPHKILLFITTWASRLQLQVKSTDFFLVAGQIALGNISL